jgi:5-methylcytosine-specific restriction endonuclease McrA
VCSGCLFLLWEPRRALSNLTMDHVVPLIRGGRSIKNNLVPACKECNNKKKYLLPMEWEEYLKGRKE